jgi:hypothetical protein
MTHRDQAALATRRENADLLDRFCRDSVDAKRGVDF